MLTTLNPRRRLGGLLGALTVLITPLAAATVLTAGPASAATCSGNGCNNTDPKTTGCWDSHAFVVKQGSAPDYGGTLQLWWSPTCQTNWAQYDSISTNPTFLWTKLQNGAQTIHFEFTNYLGWAWSDQLYAPTTNADACVQEKNPATNRFGPVDCLGQF